MKEISMQTHFRGTTAAKFATLVLFGSLTMLGSLAHAQAVLSIEPLSQNVSVGSTFAIDVNISNVNDLYGYQFDLSFNPKLISARSSSEGSFLTTGGISTFFIAGTNDNKNGIVSATADTIIGAVPGANGSGNLAVLTFDAIGAGVSSVALSGVQLIDSSFNSISSQSTGASVSVSSAIKAPEIDPASAMGALTLLFGGLAILRGRRTPAPRVTGSESNP
jgi:hypothetical protein